MPAQAHANQIAVDLIQASNRSWLRKLTFRLRGVIYGALMLVIALPASRARAWNGPGHQVIAYLAYHDESLTERDRKILLQLLKHHPHYAYFLSQEKPADVEEGEYVLARAAIWPDFVRPRYGADAGAEAAMHNLIASIYHHGEWHYVNRPFCVPRDYNPQRVGPGRVNGVTVLGDSIALARNQELPPTDRAVALAWIAHLVGDLHQPLHSVSLVSPEYPTGDQGGSIQMIVPVDREGKRLSPINLHAYWDNLLAPLTTEYAAMRDVARRIDSQRDLGVAAPEVENDTRVQTWVDESAALAVEHAYLNGRLKGTREDQLPRDHSRDDEVPSLSLDYETAAERIAVKRAQLAAHRLALILRDVVRAGRQPTP